MPAVHAWHNHVCYDAHGTAAQIAWIKENGPKNGVHDIKDGACAKQAECKDWRGMRVCRSEKHDDEVPMPDEFWTGNVGHVRMHGHCMQINSDLLENQEVVTMVEKKMAAKGGDFKRGGCKDSGAPIWHKSYKYEGHNITIRVW